MVTVELFQSHVFKIKRGLFPARRTFPASFYYNVVPVYSLSVVF